MGGGVEIDPDWPNIGNIGCSEFCVATESLRSNIKILKVGNSLLVFKQKNFLRKMFSRFLVFEKLKMKFEFLRQF